MIMTVQRTLKLHNSYKRLRYEGPDRPEHHEEESEDAQPFLTTLWWQIQFGHPGLFSPLGNFYLQQIKIPIYQLSFMFIKSFIRTS